MFPKCQVVTENVERIQGSFDLSLRLYPKFRIELGSRAGLPKVASRLIDEGENIGHDKSESLSRQAMDTGEEEKREYLALLLCVHQNSKRVRRMSVRYVFRFSCHGYKILH